MADRLLVDLSEDGRVAVGMWPESQLPQPGQPRELAWPLDDDALEDLRWYLEDYLRAPFGVYEDRGIRVGNAMAGWGEAVFSAVFGDGPARDAYMQVRHRPVELVIRSDSPELLGLPWELMTDPAQAATPLAFQMAGLSRSLPVTDPAATLPVPDGRLRVLVVISRPAGTGDVGYQMIARPLLERLDAVRGEVDLIVLRPPTLDALQYALAQANAQGQPFHVVHFDGHGVLTGRRTARAGAPLRHAGGEGILSFENRVGGAHRVPATRVAQVLADAKVPVVVLNACQSGAVGEDLEAAVATSLLKGGIASVVAMAYSVFAVAAAEFMAAFYEQLFTGDTVTAAVTAGRRRLYQHNKRPSPKGEMPLSDWLVPVHYWRRDVSFPQAHTERARESLSLDQFLDKARQPSREAGLNALDAAGTFVGRDDLFYRLEVAARLQKVVVLHGTGGTGKTELAKAFGRWWRDTGGVECPDWVFWHSFEPGVASFRLDSVIIEIGLRLFGTDFARLESAERRDVVQGMLTERRALLIWDNFETVRSMPDPAGTTKPLDDAGCAELRGFLGHLAERGQSSVLITTRTTEDWLGEVRHLAVGGLASHEANEYAEILLAPYPAAAPRRAHRAFGELMEWLDGHPLSMRLILPRLDTSDPATLLAGLRGTAPLPDERGTENSRTSSLATSISYSFAHLAGTTRPLLPVVCLFHDVVAAEVLRIFSGTLGVPERFRGASAQDWVDALDDAARVGLLTRLGDGRYRIHPALPGYLATAWCREEPEDHDTIREATTRTMLACYATIGSWLFRQIRTGDTAQAFSAIEFERRTLGSLLDYALGRGLWDEAQAISEPLNSYWNAHGLNEEAAAWAERARNATEGPNGMLPQVDTAAGHLWLFSTGNQANQQLRRQHFDDAERAYRQIMAALQAQPPSPQQQRWLVTVYHQLGMVAGDRVRLAEAEEWYRKSLTILEELGDRPGTASAYHQLGIVAHDRGRLDQAEEWYRKSLTISEELGNKPYIAIICHQLGMVAEERMRLDEAEEWYRKSLGIHGELGARPTMAATYLQLGNVAYRRDLLDEAEEWYRESLTISDELGDRPGAAVSYHQIGMVAQDRGRLDEAGEWYRKSLAIKEELGNIPGMAVTYGQLGLLADRGGQPQQALDWMVRCVALFSEFPHPATEPIPGHLARITRLLGMDVLEHCWEQVTANQLPDGVRSHVESWSGQ